MFNDTLYWTPFRRSRHASMVVVGPRSPVAMNTTVMINMETNTMRTDTTSGRELHVGVGNELAMIPYPL
jgi:hypothetical protein